MIKHTINKDSYVEFSESLFDSRDFYGVASDLLAFHKYSRKSKKPTPHKVYINKSTKDVEKILTLVNAKNQNR